MFKYNDPAKEQAGRVGNSNGESFPPGQYLVSFQKSREQLSANKKAGTQGQPQVVTEWNIEEITAGGEPWQDWDGRQLTAQKDARRSFVLKLKEDAAQNDLNEIALLLHGVDTKSQVAMREGGYVAKDGSIQERVRVAELLNERIAAIFADSNPFLGQILSLNVYAKTTANNRTFKNHAFDMVRMPEVQAHNAELRAKAGLK